MTYGIPVRRSPFLLVGLSGEPLTSEPTATITGDWKDDAPYLQPRSRGKGKQRNRWNNINNALRNEVLNA